MVKNFGTISENLQYKFERNYGCASGRFPENFREISKNFGRSFSFLKMERFSTNF